MQALSFLSFFLLIKKMSGTSIPKNIKIAKDDCSSKGKTPDGKGKNALGFT